MKLFISSIAVIAILFVSHKNESENNIKPVAPNSLKTIKTNTLQIHPFYERHKHYIHNPCISYIKSKDSEGC